jgi:hypothetical protein
MTDPMDMPPEDHGSDRYDYVEIDAPPGVRPLGEWFDQLLADPCADCRANVFLRWQGATPDDAWLRESWYVTLAHDETCPSLLKHEES